MSIKVMSWVWEHSRSKKADRLVLLAIADCAADSGGNAFPSNAELIRKTGLSERGVQGCLTNLVELGELRINRSAGPGGVNRYRIIMTPAATAPPADPAPPQEVHPPQTVRGQGVHPPAGSAGDPPQEVRGTPATTAPVTVIEPSIEPSVVQEHPPRKARQPAPPDRFDEFWAVYPRREAKDAARKAWAKAIKTAEPDVVIAGAARYRDRPDRESRYTAHASTWLNGGRWMDEPAPPKSVANGRTTGANRHVDELTPEQRRARNPFAGAIHSSQVTTGGTP